MELERELLISCFNIIALFLNNIKRLERLYVVCNLRGLTALLWSRWKENFDILKLVGKNGERSVLSLDFLCLPCYMGIQLEAKKKLIYVI